MTDIGLLTEAQDWDANGEPAAHLRGYMQCRGVQPAILPVLHRLGKTSPHRTRDRLEVLGADLNLTTLDDPDAILAGAHDGELRYLADAITPSTIVRINHEPDSLRAAPYYGWTPDTWAKVFVHIVAILGGRSFACLTDTGASSKQDWESWVEALSGYDGEAFSPVIWGFDAYIKHPSGFINRRKDLVNRLQRRIDDMRELTGRDSLILGEWGAKAEQGQASALRAATQVEGLEGFVVYDLSEWTLRPHARRVVDGWMR